MDPFWYSHEPDGGCSEGTLAKNFTASPFSFPKGLAALGVPMMLFLQGIDPKSVYANDYSFAGQSVAGKDAAKFFGDRFRELTTAPSQCSALTLDGLAGVYYSSADRYTTVDHQTLYDKGLSDAALAHKLPIRIDQESPSDILATVQYGARTVGRCTYDANPCGGANATGPWAPHGHRPCTRDSRWSELAGASFLLRAVNMRQVIKENKETEHKHTLSTTLAVLCTQTPAWCRYLGSGVSLAHKVTWQGFNATSRWPSFSCLLVFIASRLYGFPSNAAF